MKDRFSQQAGAYAKFRPVYPTALYEYLYQHSVNKDLAWDCATGNGQVAQQLATSFHQVFASDISAQQLAKAPPAGNIQYAVAPAIAVPLAEKSVDLITVAQAYHWFAGPAFFAEAMRVAKPGALIAVWGYDRLTTPYEYINEYLDYFYHQVVGPYWDPERKHVENHYRDLYFPAPSLPGPELAINDTWSWETMVGFWSTWSSLQRYRESTQHDPLPLAAKELRKRWPSGQMIPVKFPIFLWLGKATEVFP
ncbi:MAG: class I SAM-dependent methyltransferase [Lewinellaceae bacterium]|nr:class I SAM-dependent methyltransferase [Lewinellaceae bacterium]